MSTVNLISSGLEVQDIVDNLIYIQREPIRMLEKQTKTYENKVSAYQAFNSKLLAFRTSVEALLYHDDTVPLSFPASFEERLRNSIFALRTASSSDEAVLKATASKGTTTGNFTVTVTGLASSDTYASNNFATQSATPTQTGTLVIQRGSNDPITVTIDETNNTLAGIRDAINRSDVGVTASIINDGSASPYRLALTSDESGTANALTVTNNLNQGAGQALTLAQTVAAADATLQVNGVNITSSSNMVSDAIDGVTINLKAASGTAVITVERDIDSIVAGLKDFAAQYNEIVRYISTQFGYNADTEKSGVLAGDYTLRAAQSRLRTTLTQSIASDSAALQLLWQIGFKTNSDGTITVDEDKVEESLTSDFRGTAHVFLADALNAGGAVVSIAPQLYHQLKSLTDSLDGPIVRAQDAIQQNITRINKQISVMEDRLEVQREILIMQYTAADQALRRLSVLQSSLENQLNALQAM